MKEAIVASVVAGLLVYYLTQSKNAPAAIQPASENRETPGIFTSILETLRDKIDGELNDIVPSETQEQESETYA